NPADELSIRNAVMAAYYHPFIEGVRERAIAHTWDATAAETVKVYEEILGRKGVAASAKTVHTAQPEAQSSESGEENGAEFLKSLQEGEAAAKKKEFDRAHEPLSKAEAMNPRSARATRARAAVYFAQEQRERARELFQKAYELN